MSDWASNWDSTEGCGKVMRVALNDLRNAILERYAVLGWTLSPYVFEISQFDLIPSSWFTYFYYGISSLIPEFLNHTLVTNNSWVGESFSTGYAHWTESAILAEIGDSSRVSPPTGLVCAKWLYQQFNILNLLQCYSPSASTILTYSKYFLRWEDDSPGNPWSYASVLFNFTNQAWSTPSTSSYAFLNKHYQDSYLEDCWNLSASKSEKTFDMGGGDLQHIDTYYAYCYKLLTTVSFFDFGGAYIEDEYSIVGSQYSESGVTTRTVEFPTATEQPLIYSQPEPSLNDTTWQECLAGLIYVCDYSGPNGFQYLE